ncbi:MAG TPA: hypothetical protein VLE43_15105 [Candidatus Saccharimonadia bacterium]|nr:hypothetical protein [Candidatus Saccharimonadia bacterium]
MKFDFHREQTMTKKCRFLLPVFSAVTLLIVSLAVVIFLPLPEERAFNELSRIKIKSIRWKGLMPRDAVSELNAEIEKSSRTHYRFFLAEDAQNDTPLSFEFDDIPATECAQYIAERSGPNSTFGTADGIVIDHPHRGDRYYEPSWRRDFRYWVKYTLPDRWDRWRHPPGPDPFAPVP